HAAARAATATTTAAVVCILARAADRDVVGDRRGVEAQRRARGVENAAATAARGTTEAARAGGTRRGVRRHDAAGERERSGVVDAAAERRDAAADRELLERRRAGRQHVDRAVAEPVGAHDRRRRAGAAQRDVARDVEIAGETGILAG